MTKVVRGPDGSPLALGSLPGRDTKRWVIRRKAEVVAAVRGGARRTFDPARSVHAVRAHARRIPRVAGVHRQAWL